MSNKNEVFEYLIDQLRQQVNKKDVTSFKVSVRISDLDEIKQVIHNLQQHIAGKDDEIRVLKDSLRRQLPVVDVMGEIKRWSIDRSIAGRGNYTDEENAIIDAYIGLEHNPYKQQCEDLAQEVQSLRNQLRDASALVAELQSELQHQIDLAACVYRWSTAYFDEKGKVLNVERGVKDEQSGCRKEDVKGCKHDWYFYDKGASMMCRICGLKSPSRQKEDTQECKHEWQFYGVGFPCMCLKCGLKK